MDDRSLDNLRTLSVGWSLVRNSAVYLQVLDLDAHVWLPRALQLHSPVLEGVIPGLVDGAGVLDETPRAFVDGDGRDNKRVSGSQEPDGCKQGGGEHLKVKE